MIIGGIDEAGRGPVIGPMIVTIVTFKSENINQLEKIGVKDSKKLLSEEREKLESRIKKLSEEFFTKEITPNQLDNYLKKTTLNRLETTVFKNLIEKTKAETVYSDYIDNEFRQNLSQIRSKDIIIEKKADEKYLPVSAAAILAKVKRDKKIKEIESKIKDDLEIGSGYPSDTVTREFLKKWFKRYNEFPDFVRKSWKTLGQIKTEVETHKLKNF